MKVQIIKIILLKTLNFKYKFKYSEKQRLEQKLKQILIENTNFENFEVKRKILKIS